jgi:hypothetical protein
MLRWIGGTGLCPFAVINVTAQTAPNGVVLQHERQLYTYSPTDGLVAFTSEGHVTDVHVSHTGRYVSYLKSAPSDGSPHHGPQPHHD